MTSPTDKSGTSFAVPIVTQLLQQLWERLATVPKPSHDPGEGTLGRKQRELASILRLKFPPDGQVPDGMKDKEVFRVIEPEYAKIGKTPPSIDTIARARGRRKKYKPGTGRRKKSD